MNNDENQLLDLGEHAPAAPSAPSAPNSEEFGFENVGDVNNVMNAVADAVNNGKDEMTKLASDGKDDISKLLGELSESSLVKPVIPKVVSAEADSSTNEIVDNKPKVEISSAKKSEDCAACPVYQFGCEFMNKIKLPPKVEEYIMWKDPKVTGAIFGASLVLLISLASFSLLSVISTLGLLALSVAGAYRFYLALVFRIKGTQDETFEKLSNYEVKVPKERIQDISRLFETDINKSINQLKSIVLWDNITVSAITLLVCYFIYCIGSVFNTITLLILALVSLFTLPKVYQVYKVPIDQGLEKMTTCVHNLIKQARSKLPFLKKKVQ